ncbi:GlgB N-terminal domain-containing protein [Anaerococcus jeddahensis]|uniref:GlgB N-terminal domain-containing protein n=1 Tax=Anaerococcus jeddahensis TaxID=1673719 RepID=UPI0006725216|nr:1,4-alpha-glucan-branching protein [Anaerococcus jeddahensis]
MDTRKYLDGESFDGFKFFGNHKKSKNSYIFRTLGPNAKNIYIVGDFNGWKEEKLRKYSTGVFSKTINNVKEYDKYLYVIEDKNGKKSYKLDPFSKLTDEKYENSLVFDKAFEFSYKIKENKNLNIYEINFRNFDGKIFSNEKSIDKFIFYVKENNFTHVKLMDVFTYSFSYNEKLLNLEKLKLFIDICHKNDIGIIMDLDISSFYPSEKYLLRFDNSNMYNYDYDDILYNYDGRINLDPSKKIVKSFILSFISYLFDEFKLDGISFINLENLIFCQGDKSRGFNHNWLDLIKIINTHIKNLNKLSLGFYNSIWNDDIDFNLGFSYIYDRTMAKIIKIMQNFPYKRYNYSNIVKNLIETDFKKFILGFNYYDSLGEGASLAMKMHSDEKKYDQLKSLFLLTYTLNSKKILFMEDEIGSLETYSFDKKIDFKAKNQNEKDFNKFYKKISKFLFDNKEFYEENSKTQILDIEGYSLFAFKRKSKNFEYLIIINLTDLEYKIKYLDKTKTVLTSFDENLKNKNIIPAFGSGIYRIK